MSINPTLAASSAAAVFAYLSWVRMNNIGEQEQRLILEKVLRHPRYLNEEEDYKFQAVAFKVDENLVYKYLKHIFPLDFRGTTRVTISFEIGETPTIQKLTDHGLDYNCDNYERVSKFTAHLSTNKATIEKVEEEIKKFDRKMAHMNNQSRESERFLDKLPFASYAT